MGFLPIMLKEIIRLEHLKVKALIPKISYFLKITNDYSFSRQIGLSDLFEFFFF